MTTIAGVTPRVERRPLLRVLSSAFGLAIAIGATIGGGILRSPGDVAAQLPSVAVFMAVWVFGAVNAFLGAGAYAELGAMLPRAGGTYVYARRAMGERSACKRARASAAAAPSPTQPSITDSRASVSRSATRGPGSGTGPSSR